MDYFPEIETERLKLKKLTSDYAEAVYHHFASEEVNRYVDFDPTESLDDVKEIINWGLGLFENGNGILWGIFDKKNGKFIGQINFVNRASDNFTGGVHRVEIGFDLSPRYWGNGYMKEALIQSISWIFASYNVSIRRIEAIINVKNQRARKLVSNIGFMEEGVMREYVYWNKEYWDMSLYSLLKNDWTEL